MNSIFYFLQHVNGGNLEQIIENKEQELPWSLRISLALDMAKGLAYLHARGWFHRDLTSKNILIRRVGGLNGTSEVGHNNKYTDSDSISGNSTNLAAVIADFGLASKIPLVSGPGKESRRLQQVGSPYWMSPECLKGEFYDEKADIFSYGIILCELIARIDADPDILPRTINYGVDYIAFSATLSPECPPNFVELAFNCVRIDPKSRPTAIELILMLEMQFDAQRKHEKRQFLFPDKPPTTYHAEECGKITLKKVGHRRSISDLTAAITDKDASTLPLLQPLITSAAQLTNKYRYHLIIM